VSKSIKKNCISSKIEATAIMILLITAFFLAALSGTQLIEEVAAIDYTEYTGTLDGADWALRIPDIWNGMLVVCCRGYSHTPIADVRNSAPFSTMGPALLDQGFAVAASDYGVGGYCVPEGVNSTIQLTEHIIENYNVTGRVFLLGGSMGGAVVLLLGEKYPELYSGVLDLFGVKDTIEQYETKTIWGILNDTELEAELTALTAPVPPFMFPSLDTLRLFCNTSSTDIVSELGGTPQDESEAYEAVSPLYNANISIPVITVHGTSDALVPYSQSVAYQEAVADAGRSSLYRLYPVEGGQHGDPVTTTEVPVRFDELVEWSNYLTGVYDWSMFGHDLQRTGYTESPGPDTNQTLWISNFGGMAGSHPAVADGKVYISAWNALFYCFDATTGAQIWNYTSGDMTASSPAVADGKVYVGSDDDNVYCLNATTGAKIWNYTTGGDVVSCPVVANGMIYVGSKDGNLYCLSADLGQVEWNYTTGAMIELSSPAVADGKVYIGSDDNKTYCLDAANGDFIWSYLTGDQIWSSPTVAEGRIYVGSADDNVYCLNATTGAKIWNYTTGDDIGYSSPAVAYGKIYVGSHDASVYCLDAETGGLIWNYTTGGEVWGSPTVADGKAYVGSYDNKFYCLNATDGALVWSYTTGGIVLSSPVVANGVAFALSADQTLYAFGSEYLIPESFTVVVVALLSTVAFIVSFWLLRKKPKWRNSLLKKL
jgi:outer membrane protein assembly factor BamB